MKNFSIDMAVRSANRDPKRNASGQAGIDPSKLEPKALNSNVVPGPNTETVEYYEGEGKTKVKVKYETPRDLIDSSYQTIVIKGLALQPEIAAAQKRLDDLKYGTGSTDKEVYAMGVECANRCKGQNGGVNLSEAKAMFKAVCSAMESRYEDEAKTKGYEHKTLAKAISQWAGAKTAIVTLLSPTSTEGNVPSLPAIDILSRKVDKDSAGNVTLDEPRYPTMASVRKAVSDRRIEAKKAAGGNAQTEKLSPSEKILPGLAQTTDQFTAYLRGLAKLANILDAAGIDKLAANQIDAIVDFSADELAEPVMEHLRTEVKLGVEFGKLDPYLRALSQRGIGPKVAASPIMDDDKVGVDDGKAALMRGGSKA